jgi:hypothetical protein
MSHRSVFLVHMTLSKAKKLRTHIAADTTAVAAQTTVAMASIFRDITSNRSSASAAPRQRQIYCRKASPRRSTSCFKSRHPSCSRRACAHKA